MNNPPTTEIRHPVHINVDSVDRTRGQGTKATRHDLRLYQQYSPQGYFPGDANISLHRFPSVMKIKTETSRYSPPPPNVTSTNQGDFLKKNFPASNQLHPSGNHSDFSEIPLCNSVSRIFKRGSQTVNSAWRRAGFNHAIRVKSHFLIKFPN